MGYVDVAKQAKDAGFVVPVTISPTVLAAIEPDEPAKAGGETKKGAVRRLLNLSALALTVPPLRGHNRVFLNVTVFKDKKPRRLPLVLERGAGNGVLIMHPAELS